MSYSADNYWDETNCFSAEYSIEKNFELYSGVKVSFDVSIPKDATVEGNMVAYVAFLMGDDYSGWIQNSTTISWNQVEINGDKLTVPVSFIMPDDCLQYGILHNITLKIIGSGTSYNGDIFVSNVKVYNGLQEVEDIPEEETLKEKIVYSNPNADIYSKSVSFNETNNWDDSQFQYQISLNGINNKLSNNIVLSFDLYLNYYPNEYNFSKMFAYVGILAGKNYDGWIQNQDEIVSSEFDTTGRPVSHVKINLSDDLLQYDVLQSITIKMIGSGTKYSGNLSIGNIKLYSTTDTITYPNTIEKDLTIKEYETLKFSYNATVLTRDEAIVYNNATFGNENEYVTDKNTIKVEKDNSQEATDGAIGLKKEIAYRDVYNNSDYTPQNDPYNGSGQYGPYESELNVLGDGDIIYYTVTLSNGTTQDKTLTLSDYSPLFGNYRAIDYNPTWYKYDNVDSLDSNMMMFGKDTTSYYGPTEMFRDFADNLISVNRNTPGKYTFTLKIPANTVYKQTFILRMPNDYSYKSWEDCARKKIVSYNYADSSSSTYNIAYVPHNTIIIDGTKISSSVRHTLEREYQINQFVLGDDFFEEHSYGGNTLDNRMFANYYLKDNYNLVGSRNQYILYGATIVNDSTEPLYANNIKLTLNVPSNMEFVEPISPDYNLKNQFGIRFHRSSSTSNVGRSYTNELIKIRNPYSLSGATYMNQTNEVAGFGISGYKKDSWGNIEFSLAGTNDTYDYYNAPATRQPYYTEEYYDLNASHSAWMAPYTCATVYYLMRIKDNSNKYSNTISPRIEMQVKNLNNIKISNMEVSFYNNNKYPGSSTNLMGTCFRTGSAAVSSMTYQSLSMYSNANIYNSVVGRNNYRDVMNGNILMNVYEKDMNKFTLSDDEVVTFCVVVANGDQGDYSHNYTVNVNIPTGFEFLGCHTINPTTNYTPYLEYVNVTYDTETYGSVYNDGFGRVLGIRSRSYSGRKNYFQEYTLSNLITDYGNINGALPQQANAAFWTCNGYYPPKTNISYNSYNNYYYLSSRGSNYLSFGVCQPSSSATYIFYSCKVNKKIVNKNVTNEATLSNRESGSLKYFDGMDYAPFYNSNYAGAIRVNEDGQNIAKGYVYSNGSGDSNKLVGTIKASVNLTGVPVNKSASIEKQVLTTFDIDNITKEGAYYEGGQTSEEGIYTPDGVYYKNNDGTTLGGVSDNNGNVLGRFLSNFKDKKNNYIYNSKVLSYSIIDGIHSTNDYRSSVVWKVTVRNDADSSSQETIDASQIIEKIDKPFKLYGYSGVLFDNTNTVLGCIVKNLSAVEPDAVMCDGYTSKTQEKAVDRNVYELDLADDMKAYGQSQYRFSINELSDILKKFPAGYHYDLYLFTDMTEEVLDWYYDTTILKLDNIDEFKFNQAQSIAKGYEISTGGTSQDAGIKNDDWVSVIASDGIKYIDKYNKSDDQDVSSKSSTIYRTTEKEQEIKFTLEMASYLYQTKYYQKGILNNIIMYDLLPGVDFGGIKPDEVGGGYTINPDSFEAYILKTDGGKEVIDPSHYKVMYSLDSLHGGRHPSQVPTTNDTAYHVDFAKASNENIWLEEYNQDCRSLRIVFDETVSLENADRLYVDYTANMREDAEKGIEYHSVMGYIYDCVNTEDPEKTLRLYEDTVDLSVKDDTKGIKIKKSLIDSYDEKILRNDEKYGNYDFEFGLYSYEGNYTSATELTELGTFTLRATYDKDLDEIFESLGIDPSTISGNYAIKEKENEDTNLKTINTVEGANQNFGNKRSNNVFTFTADEYKSKKDKNIIIEFTNKVKASGEIKINKVDENDNIIRFKDTQVTYQIFDNEDNVVKFKQQDGKFYYDEKGELDSISSSNNPVYIYYMPLGTYTIKEIEAPNNFAISNEVTLLNIEDEEKLEINIKNRKINPNNLIVKKVDSQTGEIIGSEYGEATFKVQHYLDKNWVDITLKDLNILDEKGHHYSLDIRDEENTTDIVTTYNGKIYIENVEENLKFVEQTAPFGYSIINTSNEFTYSPTVLEEEFSIKNRNNGNYIIVHKKDEITKKLLNHVTFNVLKNNTNEEDEIKEVCKLIYVGTETYTYEKQDYEIPVYSIVSQDYEGENIVTEISTDNGIIKIQNIPSNEYSLQEIEAPEGYELSDTIVPISTGLKSMTVNNMPKNGYVAITKKNDQDEIITEPVTFEIYNENNEKQNFVFVENEDANSEDGNVYEYTTTEENIVEKLEIKNGKLKINKLPVGTYILKEIDKPEGYTLEEDLSFTITPENSELNPLALDVINVHSTGNVVFTKVNTNEETILETATFNILNSDDELLKFTKQEDVYIPDENGTPDVSTTEGKISINNLPLGTYKLVETVAPETYKAGEITEFKVKGENYYEPAQINVVNKHAYGDVNITKLDVNGEVIESDVVTFKIYDENNNVVNFELNNEEENKTYEYNVNGTHSRISTSKGKLSLKKLPIGKYYLEELIAPQGYTLLEDKLEFEVTDAEFTTPLDFAVVNPDYIFGSEEYVSSSFEKIEEKDLPSNNGYGYFGKESDYEIGNKNYIYVDAKEDTVRYTLRIGNMSKQNFENVVLINKLPDIGDTGVINLNKERDSEFTVKIANNPNYEIYLIDNNQEIVESPAYTIEYTDEIAYTESDWNGDTNDRWYQEPRESTKAFRIKFAEGFILPSLYGIEFRFDGTIQDNAEPGKIAWDSFGYRYYVNGTQLSPEPPKVGVKIPYEPLLTKIVEDDIDGEFEFEIFEKDPVEGEKLVHTLKVKSGETANLELKKVVNGVESGYLEQDKDYIIREKTTKQFKEVHVEGINGKAYSLTEGGAFEFEYDKGTLVDVTFTNAERKLGEVSLEKFDLKTGEKLPGAEFELRDSDGTALNVEKVEDHYVYRKDKNENTTTKLYTNDEGKINVKELPYGDYVLYETKQPDGYLYGIKHDYKFTINDDAFDLKANGEVVVKPIKIDVYNEPTQIMLEKYYDEEIHGVKYDGSIDGALLQIWDKDKKVMYSEITTDGLGSLDVSRLPIGEYVLVEEIAPKGFKKADDIYFKIAEDGKLIIDEKEVEDKTVKMKDEALLGKIILNKKAEVIKDIGVFEVIGGLLQRLFSWITGTLKDVSFEIYASEDIYIQDKLVFEKDKLIDTITTNDLGVAILEDIPVGNYYAVEVKTGDDYELEKIPISLKLEYDDTDQEIVCEKTIVNERKIAKINIHKTDSKDKNIPVENAVFGLYSAEKQGIFKKDELVLIAITNSEGIATFGENLPVGKYYIKEIQAPEGYYKSKERIDFEFKDTDEFNFEFVNEKKPVEEKPVVPNVTVVNNNVTNNYIYGTSSTSGSNGAVASSGERTPNTGDLLPIIVSYIMSITLIANIAQIIISKKKKK